MSGHEGCGCGHAHAVEQLDAVEGQEAHMHGEHDGMGGCGDGCACGPADGTSALETAALRGFLSGIYASRLDAGQLRIYLEQMGEDDASEFGRPAQFLATVLEGLREQELLKEDEAPAFTLLDAVAGEDDEEGGEEE